ncbi:MAG TPA: isoprenylcysteine carboxylmethyltransferase family protein [Acidimicrobiales bacterium]|nr:isoprenylcysteine carboxylmethyltransferase family protein [Acidimicrobiales bacterium]
MGRRVARPAGPAANVAKTVLQIVVVWGFALGALPWLAVQAEDAVGVARWDWPGRHVLGAVVLVAGSSLGLVSAWVMATVGRGTPVPFDAARELVVVGPYRVVRNPMAVSAAVQMVGVAIAYGSAATLALAVGGAVLWNVAIRPGEERFLAERFGRSYEAYRAAVRCWVPRRHIWRAPGVGVP